MIVKNHHNLSCLPSDFYNDLRIYIERKYLSFDDIIKLTKEDLIFLEYLG